MSALPPAAPVTPPSLNSSLGAIEIGILTAYCLFGISLAQLYIYYQSGFIGDGKGMKLLLALVMLGETTHTILIGIYIYDTTVIDFGNYGKLQLAHWALGASVPVGNFVQCLVPGFFAWRIYCISKQRWITVASWIGSAVRFGSSIAIAVLSHGRELDDFVAQYRWIVTITLSCGVAVDILNTSALSYYLYRARGEISRSRKMVETLIVWTIETGLLTTSTNIASLILLLALPSSPAFLSLSMIFAKLYANSFLASLNGRLSLRINGAQTHVTVSGMNFERSSQNANPIQVDILRQRTKMRDPPERSGGTNSSNSDTLALQVKGSNNSYGGSFLSPDEPIIKHFSDEEAL